MQNNIKFNGISISKDKDFTIHVHMTEYLASIQPISLPRVRRRASNGQCTNTELLDFRALKGKLNFLGHVVLPLKYLVATEMQQSASDIRVHQFATAKDDLHALDKPHPTLTFLSPTHAPSPSQFVIQTFADASAGFSTYNKTVLIFEFLLPMGYSSDDLIFHRILLHGFKKALLSFSSVRLETLAAPDAVYRFLNVHDCLPAS